MANIGMGVTLLGVDHPEFGYTYNLSASTTKSHLGRGVTVDTTAPNTMKPAGDGDLLRGVLFTFEDRVSEGLKVGTVRHKGGYRLPIAAGQVVTVGQSVVGAGDGYVKAAASPSPINFVAEVTAGYAVVVFL